MTATPAMKFFLLLFLATVPVARGNTDDSLPDISAASLVNISDLCHAICVADFPMRQGDMKRLLGLSEMRMLYGTGGKNMRSYHVMALTNKTPTGDYYGIRVYYGRNPTLNSSNAADFPVEEIAVFFYNFSVGEFIYEKPQWDEGVLDRAKAEMKRDGLTPIAWARSRFHP
jgi:hypothetical protein